MSGEQLARTFLEATRGYVGPKAAVPRVRLGTVDSGFAGTGRPRVLFDGEATLGLRTYAWVNVQPTAGQRVVLAPQGSTYVIVGVLETAGDAAIESRARLAARDRPQTLLSLDPTKWSGPVGSRLTIPTHVSPAGGQTTHPSVLFFPDGWNGYRYWMAHTPYPSGNDDHEDPNLAVSNDGITWVAAPGVTQPLDDADGTPEYNSDTDLVFGPNDTMYLFWRHYDSSLGSNQEKVYVRTSTDGATWTARVLVYQYTETALRPLSPSFAWDGTRWTVYAVDIAPATPRLIRMQTAGAALSEWSAATAVTVSAIPGGFVPWHVEVRRIFGQWVGLLYIIPDGAGGADGYLLLMTSTTGTAFTSGGRPLIPMTQAGEHDQLYRATAVPEFLNGVLGLRVWYSAFLDGPPVVWNIYRTFVGLDALTHVESGSGTLASVAAGAGIVTTVTFSRPFVGTPDVTFSTNSTRLGNAITAISETGFSFRVDNFSPASASTPTYEWTARGRAGVG